MFKKVNPYLRDELSVEAVAHKCGCRCRRENVRDTNENG